MRAKLIARVMIGVGFLLFIAWGILTLSVKRLEDQDVRDLITKDYGSSAYICDSSKNGFIDFASRMWGGPMVSYTYIVNHDGGISVYYIEKNGCWYRTDYEYMKPNIQVEPRGST